MSDSEATDGVFDSTHNGSVEKNSALTSSFDTIDTFDTTLEKVGRERGTFFHGDDLMSTEFPPIKWAVEGLIGEGVTIIAGAQKAGKSWLGLTIALDVASGNDVLGCLKAEQGPVLYFPLEDPGRRVQRRLRMLGDKVPHDLVIMTELPPLPKAGLLLDEYLRAHPDTRMVIIDVLQKIRPIDESAKEYKSDYMAVGAIKNVSDGRHVPIILIHHTRKMKDTDDVFNEVTGSVGITGASDGTIIVKRARGENSGTLYITGRDVPEAEYAIKFDPDHGRWSLDGSSIEEASRQAAKLVEAGNLGDRSLTLLEIVKDHPDGITPMQAAEQLEISNQGAGDYLGRLVKQGRIRRVKRGVYAPNETDCVNTVENVETVERADQTGQFFSTPQNDSVENMPKPLRDRKATCSHCPNPNCKSGNNGPGLIGRPCLECGTTCLPGPVPMKGVA